MKKVNISNSIEIKTLCFSKSIIKKMKISATDYERKCTHTEKTHFLLKRIYNIR